MQPVLEGSCLCGEVQYRIKGEAKRFYHCHCSRCRKATGTGHASNLFVKPGELEWIRGEALIGKYKVPDAEYFATWFCKHCGGKVPRPVEGSDAIVIPAGSLDSKVPMKPQARIFWDSRVDWSCEGDDLPVFAEYRAGSSASRSK